MTLVRPATPADAPAISTLAREVQVLHESAHPAIFRPASSDTFPPAAIRELMAQPGHAFWVAEEGPDPVGYAYAVLQALPDNPWHRARTFLSLEQMGVTASHQGRGIGARLLDAVRAAAMANGAQEVRLSVWSFNEPARAFYAREGFTGFQERLWLPLVRPGAGEA
jgi:ribosomal-protein-alanine N-acetyltransferase